MDLKNLLPSLGKKRVPVKREEENPVMSLQREINRMFEGMLQGWNDTRYPGEFSSTFTPRLDMTEDDKAVKVSAELPGMTDKDIEVSLGQDTLTIRGEKKNEHEERRDNYFYSERSFGSFSRTIRIPREIETSKVQADFRKGVLTITLPKSAANPKAARRIAVKTE